MVGLIVYSTCFLGFPICCLITAPDYLCEFAIGLQHQQVEQFQSLPEILACLLGTTQQQC